MLAHEARKHADELRRKYFEDFLSNEKANVSSKIALYRYKSFFTNLYEFLMEKHDLVSIEQALLCLTNENAKGFVEFMQNKRRPRYAQNGIATIRDFYRFMNKTEKCKEIPFVFQSNYPLTQLEHDLVKKFAESSTPEKSKNKDYKSKRYMKALLELYTLSGKKDGMLVNIVKSEVDLAIKKLTSETKGYIAIWKNYFKYLIQTKKITQAPMELGVLPDTYITDYQGYLTSRQATPHSIRELRSHILRLYKLLPNKKSIATLTITDLEQIIKKVKGQVKHNRAVQFVATWRRFFTFLKDHLKNSELSVLVDTCQLD